MQKIDALYLRKYLELMEKDGNDMLAIEAMFGDVIQVAGFSGIALKSVDIDGNVTGTMVEKGRMLDDEESLIKLPIIVGRMAIMNVVACCGNVGFGPVQIMNLANIALAVQSIIAKDVYSSQVPQQEAPVKEEVKVETDAEEIIVEEIVVGEDSEEETTTENVADNVAEDTKSAEEPVKEQTIVNVVADVSVEELYEGVFSIMDRVPAGFAVLDNKKGEVLYMNKLAEETIPAQNAMGAALAIYEEKGQNDVGEVQDEDSGLWFDISFVPVKWKNGDEVLMSAAVDLRK